jgi:hypothetical protein
VGDRVPVYSPSGGYIGHYPERVAWFVKLTNDHECRTLKGRGGHWYTNEELAAMRERASRTQTEGYECVYSSPEPPASSAPI